MVLRSLFAVREWNILPASLKKINPFSSTKTRYFDHKAKHFSQINEDILTATFLLDW